MVYKVTLYNILLEFQWHIWDDLGHGSHVCHHAGCVESHLHAVDGLKQKGLLFQDCHTLQRLEFLSVRADELWEGL